jgi:hypothetical protein
MFNPNKITKILGATFVLVSSNSLLAETVSTATVSATVQNAFSLVETTALDFGTVRASAEAGGTNVGTLVLNPNGSTTVTSSANAAITSLGTPVPGVFTVSGAAPFTDLFVTFPGDFSLTTAGAPPTSPTFDIPTGSWTGLITGGANDGATLASTTNIMQTTSTGGVVLTVGATLTTDADASSSPYIDAAYTGTYTMTVNYN